MLQQHPVQEIIRFSHVSMQYPGVLANDDISLSVKKGEVFALVGENGAGKSTLMNLLYGLERPTFGDIYISEKKTSSHHNPERAMASGVSMVHQHFKLVPSFTVSQNIWLGSEPKTRMGLYDMDKANQMTTELSERYGLEVNPADISGELSVGLQQRVEILKALRHGAQVLILDEPTAVLTRQETDELFEVIRRMVNEREMTVILITHKLPEVMRISDRIGVMKRGKLVDVLQTANTDERAVASLMVGREVIFDDLRSERPCGEPVLEIKDLQALGDRGLMAIRDFDLAVRTGEIVGVCGVEGNGQSELAECIMGMRTRSGGTVRIGGRDTEGLSPREIRAMGVSYIPEDRMRTGLSVKADITENLLVGKQRSKEFRFLRLHLRRGKARRYAEALSREFDIRTSGMDEQMSSLSGGNMQKAVLAREFSFGTPLLVISQPTRGVDIGAIEFIHEKIIAKRNDGCAVLLISADLDELFRLSDRFITVFEGRVTGRFEAGSITREEIGYYMTGGRQEGAEQ